MLGSMRLALDSALTKVRTERSGTLDPAAAGQTGPLVGIAIQGTRPAPALSVAVWPRGDVR